MSLGGPNWISVTPAALRLPIDQPLDDWAYIEPEPLPDAHELHRALLRPEPLHAHHDIGAGLVDVAMTRQAALHPEQVERLARRIVKSERRARTLARWETAY